MGECEFEGVAGTRVKSETCVCMNSEYSTYSTK